MKNKMFRVSFKIILIITFILIYTSTVFAFSAISTDNSNSINETYWAHDCIVSLLRAQIITGYDDGSIKPENNITREEVAVMIAKALVYKNLNIKLLPVDYKSIYKDRISNWALEYVNLITYNNVFFGYPDNTFKAKNNITREEAAKVIAIAFNKPLSNDYELNFADNGNISDWSLPYVKTLVKVNILKGYSDNTFKPLNEITRAEFFSIMCNELELHDQKMDDK